MEKRGLGKGLAALITDTFAPDDNAAVREIPLDQIVPNPYQPRTLFDPIKLEEMAASIRQHGILQPVLVRRVGHERYQIIAGERRYRAALKANLPSLPAMVRELTDQEQLELAIVENVQREDIGPIEEARAYRRLAEDFGLSQQVISQRVGKSPSAISNTIRLLNLPDPIIESVEQGEITEGHARALQTLDKTPHSLLDVWRTVKQRGLSVRDTERLTRTLKSAADTAAASNTESGTVERNGRSLPQDADERAAVTALRDKFKTKVTVRHNSDGSGRLEIEFYSPQELEGLIEMLLAGGREKR